MKFRARAPEEPEINLIPFIDVLLVILIFLMLTTTYSKFTEMQLTLPTANTDAQRDRPKEIIVAVGNDGRYMVGQTPLAARTVKALADALRAVAQPESTLIISADAQAAHQSVIAVMEAARRVGLAHITFAAQSGGEGSR
ncbi:MAG: biopolymer transporter ExbD [Burkholderiaceae bacterium]|nr:biopolymer transporter ExbD [Burkholderiaceae bacterium]